MAARPARTHLVTRTGRASSGVDEVLAIALASSSGAKLVLPHRLDPIKNMTCHTYASTATRRSGSNSAQERGRAVEAHAESIRTCLPGINTTALPLARSVLRLASQSRGNIRDCHGDEPEGRSCSSQDRFGLRVFPSSRCVM